MADSRLPVVWYFPLEPLKSRYTQQLCERWIPDAFEQVLGDDFDARFVVVPSELPTTHTDITVGVVLDAVGRGLYSLGQTATFLRWLADGRVRTGDKVFFQDFWTPGLEAILYAAHLYNVHLDIYSTVYAQSVDEYDFTHPMKAWIRSIEHGYANVQAGLFVASTIHKQQLRLAGFTAPIHVVGLQLDDAEVAARMPTTFKTQTVVYSSRLDWEKQPLFMIDVARAFLSEHPTWRWVVTTSRDTLVSNRKGVVDALRAYAASEPRFVIKTGLSKDEYYTELAQASIQFNCALQDYVAFTLLEASIAGCDVVYPDYRSFPECVPSDRRYRMGSIDSAVRVLSRAVYTNHSHRNIAHRQNAGRLEVANIVVNGRASEYNVWTSTEGQRE